MFSFLALVKMADSPLVAGKSNNQPKLSVQNVKYAIAFINKVPEIVALVENILMRFSLTYTNVD